MQKTDEYNKFILSLIESVKKRECIWKIKSAAHSRKDKVEAAWQEVSDEVGKPEDLCRSKWKNLKTGFFRSIGEYSASQKQLSADKRKIYYLYDEMAFLIPYTVRLNSAMKNELSSLSDKSVTYHLRDNNDDDDENQIDIKYFSSDTQNSTKNNNDTVVNDTTKNSDPLKTIRQVKVETATKNKRKLQNNPNNNEEDDDDSDDENLSSQSSPSSPSLSPFKQSEQYKDKTKKNKKKKKRFKKPKTIEERSLRAFLKGCIPDILSLSHKNRLTLKRKVLEIIEELCTKQEITKNAVTISSVDQ